MKKFVGGIALATAAVYGNLAPRIYAQATNSGDVRGIVTDPSGAVIPNATVVVKNVETGVEKTIHTNSAGLYDTNSIVVGTYNLTFQSPGFNTFERDGITLQVGLTTVNASLKVGTTTDVVTVDSNVPLLDADTGTQKTTLEAKQMQVLPNVGQDWQNFAITLPGSAGAQGSNNPGQVISANGNLPYNNILADGSSTTLGTSQNADVQIFETVQEVQISTSGFSAQYGIGGIIFNQISKGGTSHFHGAAYDYFQSDQFNANGVYRFNNANAVNKPHFHYNNFGGSIGGPVLVPGLKNKAFFYFNYDQKISHGTATGFNDVPTVAVMNGDFTGQSLLYDPTTQTVGHDANGTAYPIRQTFLSENGTNAIPAALIDKVSANFQKFYPTPDNHIAGGQFQPGTVNGQGVLQHNFYGQVAQSSPSRRYFGRLDYDITPKNRATFSVTEGDTPATAPSVLTFAPIGYGSQDVSFFDSQFTDVATITPNLTNEARIGFTYQGNFFADLTYGRGYPQQLGWQYAKADEIPGVQFYTNYPYAWIQPTGNQFIYKENVIAPSDVVTYVKGRHILHFGGEVDIYRNDNTPYASINPGTLGFAGNYTANYKLVNGIAQRDFNTGASYADFLLGDANNWSAQNGGEYGARLKTPQFFAQDDFKVRPNLTINAGLRYQTRFGISAAKGNVGVYDPTIVNSANGQLGGYWYGTTHTNGRTSLEDARISTFLPRVGFSYLPNPTMTIRGGAGLYAYNLSIDTYGGGLGIVNTASGSGNDLSNGVTPYTTFSGPGTQVANNAPLPYTQPGTSPTRFNGQGAVTYVAYDTPDPKIVQYNMSIQQAAGPNMVFELAYVGSHGYDLVFNTDLNQVPEAYTTANNSKYRPNQNYQQINGSTNDGISNYNSLQAQMNRRLVHGISFDFNYTWSHFLDTGDSSGWGGHAGNGNYREYQHAYQNYSNSNFDVRNQFKGRIVWEPPVGKGRAFFNHNTVVDEVFGGYQISSTMQISSGNPFSVFSPTTDGSEPGQNHNPFPDVTGAQLYPAHRTITQWFNPGAFAEPAANAFGNARRNMLYGPNTSIVNASAGKRFDIYESVKLQIRVDATNVFNHPNFFFGNNLKLPAFSGQQPGQAFTQSAFGSGSQITQAENARTLQAGVRLEF